MVFNKVEAFKLAAVDYRAKKVEEENRQGNKKSKVPLIDYKTTLKSKTIIGKDNKINSTINFETKQTKVEVPVATHDSPYMQRDQLLLEMIEQQRKLNSVHLQLKLFTIKDERQKYDEQEISDLEEEEDSEYGDEVNTDPDDIISSSPP